MAILVARTVWRREPSRKRRANPMTPEAQANVARALRILRVRYGSWKALAEAMGTTRATLQTVTTPAGRKRLGAGIAIRAAKVAGVPVDDLLAGAWPKDGACPWCGRCGT